jgi:hypothetical protein
MVISLGLEQFVVFGVGKLNSFGVGGLSSAFSFCDLDVVVGRSASTFRRWCDLDSDGWPSSLGLTAFSALKVFDQQRCLGLVVRIEAAMTVLFTLLAPCSYRDRASILWQAVTTLVCDLGSKVGTSGSAISFGRRWQRRTLFRVGTHGGNSEVNRGVVRMHERYYGRCRRQDGTEFGRRLGYRRRRSSR